MWEGLIEKKLWWSEESRWTRKSWTKRPYKQLLTLPWSPGDLWVMSYSLEFIPTPQSRSWDFTPSPIVTGYSHSYVLQIPRMHCSLHLCRGPQLPKGDPGRSSKCKWWKQSPQKLWWECFEPVQETQGRLLRGSTIPRYVKVNTLESLKRSLPDIIPKKECLWPSLIPAKLISLCQ